MVHEIMIGPAGAAPLDGAALGESWRFLPSMPAKVGAVVGEPPTIGGPLTLGSRAEGAGEAGAKHVGEGSTVTFTRPAQADKETCPESSHNKNTRCAGRPPGGGQVKVESPCNRNQTEQHHSAA